MSGDDVAVVAQLHDPVRRALYDFVVGAGEGVGRGAAAEAVGVSRTLAAHHLDRLVEVGLLESGFRAPVKKGPGSGRPAKVYRRAPGERSVSLPPRDYSVLATVLADVVELLGAGEQAEQAARRAGERLGRRHAAALKAAEPKPHTEAETVAHAGVETVAHAGAEAAGRTGVEAAGHTEAEAVERAVTARVGGSGAVVEVLKERGYEPYTEAGMVRMRNCPFHALSEEQPVLVCSMNLALCQGLLEGLGDDPARAALDPRPGECCVALSKTNED